MKTNKTNRAVLLAFLTIAAVPVLAQNAFYGTVRPGETVVIIPAVASALPHQFMPLVGRALCPEGKCNASTPARLVFCVESTDGPCSSGTTVKEGASALLGLYDSASFSTLTAQLRAKVTALGTNYAPIPWSLGSSLDFVPDLVEGQTGVAVPASDRALPHVAVTVSIDCTNDLFSSGQLLACVAAGSGPCGADSRIFLKSEKTALGIFDAANFSRATLGWQVKLTPGPGAPECSVAMTPVWP